MSTLLIFMLIVGIFGYVYCCVGVGKSSPSLAVAEEVVEEGDVLQPTVFIRPLAQGRKATLEKL